jgi:type IV pilus assembly protein PilF
MKRWFLVAALLLLAGCASQSNGVPSGEGNNIGSDGRPVGAANSPAQIHTELAAGYFARGQYAVALDELRRALGLDASYPPAYNVLGLLHAELREDKLAEENFRKAIDLSPLYSDANNNLGYFLCQRGRIDEAMERFDTALRNPLYATPENALANAGACSLKKGDLARAEVYFMRALKFAPRMPFALLGKAETDFRQGRLLAAQSVLKQMTTTAQVSAQALWLGVRVERGLGDREAELSYGEQLRRRFPEAMQTQWLVTGQYDESGNLL